MTAPPSIADELRGAGLRVTAARVALLEAVRNGDHLDVEAIASGVRDRVGHVSLQAVYEAMHDRASPGLGSWALGDCWVVVLGQGESFPG